MNTTWKKYKEFIILGILGAIIFVLVLILLFSEMDKIIQSELIVILVFITLYYAIQTRRLVEEEKRKTIADFAERRLQDFHLPLKHSFIMLHVLLNHPDIFLDSVSTFNSELVKLFFKYDYMVKAETDDAFHNLVDVLDKEKEVITKVKQAKDNEQAGKILLEWGKEIAEKMKTAREKNESEIEELQSKIKEVYTFSEK